MQVLWQVSVSLNVFFYYIINKNKTDRIEKESSKLVLEAFFAFVNWIINKKKTNRENTKRLEKLVLVFLKYFFKE